MLLAPKGFSHYWKAHYTDRIYDFRGLYRWNTFDTAMLIPYFIVMVILAFYGVHRYQLVWLYYKNRKNAPKWNEPPARFAEGELPFVTIQLPIFNEPGHGTVAFAEQQLTRPNRQIERAVGPEIMPDIARLQRVVWVPVKRQSIRAASPPIPQELAKRVGRLKIDARRRP